MQTNEELLATIENYLAQTDFPAEPELLYAPIGYSLGGGGKRLRPMLVMLSCGIFSDQIQSALPAAAAVEMFHNFTLLHDDIMDNDEQKAKQILGQLKIHNFNQKIGELSGGQLKRVALANVLITDPELIILDEPTNHLDLEMTEWLEDYLSRANISILMVTHDRYFLDRVCSEIIEIDNKQIYSYKGNYSYYLEKRQERVEAMNADVERAKNLLRTELDWMRRQPQARGTKAKYRIDAFYELEKKAKQQRDTGKVNLDVKASYIGSKIFEAVNVSKRFGDLKITEDFNYIFARYEKMGIVGNNGTGKSTFIKMLMGEVAPDSGHFDVGETGSLWLL